jgi:ribonuclease BN (tRNA processing enzyme)
MIKATLKSRLQEDICLMLQVENHSLSYLCDCGMASDLTVKDCRDTAAIFVSHTHIDHFIGFDQVMRHQLGIGRRVIVCGPAGIAQNVQHKMLAFNWNLMKDDELAVSYEVRESVDEAYIEAYDCLEDQEMAEKNKHSMAGISGKLLREASVKKAVPIHFSRRYQDPEGQTKLLAEFQAAFEGKTSESISFPSS